jgi:hypothetical protein
MHPLHDKVWVLLLEMLGMSKFLRAERRREAPRVVLGVG